MTPLLAPGRVIAAGLVGLSGAVVLPVLGPAAPASAEECSSSQTRYIKQASYNLQALGFPQAWRLNRGRGVKVAVVDSGVDVGNAHLSGAGVVAPGVSFVPGDKTGREDVLGHGTGLAGIIAGRPRSDKGSALVGAAPEATILPVRVFVTERRDSTEPAPPFSPDVHRMALGIRWAATHGARVINVSMSTDPSNSRLPELLSAVAFARRQDIVVVASTGDSSQGSPIDQVRYPAGAPGVIGVAATNTSGVVDDWSVHTQRTDVVAPGSDVLIAYRHNGDCLAGNQHPETSWATGYVSGLAALLRERYPHESADQIAYRITASAERPREDSRDGDAGWGTIQPYDALTMTLDPDRPGPALPGAAHPPRETAARTALRPLASATDPLGPARRTALWWGLGTLAVTGVALVLRPLVSRRVRRS